MPQFLKNYLAKMRGGGNKSPHAVNWRNALCSWLGAFIGLALLGWLSTSSSLTEHDHLILIGSFGATAVLLYGSPAAPFAQPRYVLGGHFISAVVGVTVYLLLPEPLWLASALAVSIATVLMYLTHTTHPPGGATALVAIIGSDSIHAQGYWYVLNPVMLGIVLLLLVALVVNNLSPLRKYPNYWW
jgi:CBS-domain-containing membrane protein